MQKKIIWAIIALIILGGISYAITYKPTQPAAVIQTPVDQQPATAAPVLKIGTSSTLGTYLTAANGMTLYLYTKDTNGTSVCSGTCAVNWPPYTVPAAGALAAEASITGKVGTFQRADGTIQVTYNGAPLYFWIKDSKIGDTTGQNVGGVWFIVHP